MAGPPPRRPTARAQTHTWTFNAFELCQKTRGNPLITVTMTLLERYELLVSREPGGGCMCVFVGFCVCAGAPLASSSRTRTRPHYASCTAHPPLRRTGGC